MDKLPKGSRILDVGCGIGGSARILSNDYGFDVVGISISEAQIRRANELTTKNDFCRFEVMNALDLKFEKGSFDGVWSVEAGPHIVDKQTYADGSVASAVVVESVPRRMFDRNVIRAVLKWKFKPRIVNGVPVERRAIQRLDFNLDDLS